MAKMKDPVEEAAKTFRNDDDMAMSRVLDDFDASQATRENDFDTAWDRYHRNWRGKIKKTAQYPLVSTSFIPITHTFVETMVPFFMDAVYDERRFIIGVGQTPEDEENAKLVGKYQNYQFTQRIKYGEKLTDTIRAMLIYGTAWQKVFYDVSSRPFFSPMPKEERERREGQFQKDGKKERLKYFDGPNVEYVSPYDVYPDFGATEVENMRFLVHEYRVPLSKLKEMERGKDDKVILKNLDQVAATQLPEEYTEKFIGRLESQGRGGGRSNSTIEMSDEDQREDSLVQILDWWSPTWLIRVVNRKVVIFNGPNPLPFKGIPFVQFVATREPGFLYGIGIPEIIESPQNVVNVLQNQKLDNVNFILNPPTKVRRTAAINTKQLVSRPGGFIFVNNPDDVTAHVMQDVTGTALANINDMIRHAQDASGVLDLFRGEQPATSRFPASGISLLQKASGRRFTLTVKQINRAITKIIGMAHAIDGEFTTGDRVARVIGADGTVEEYPTVSGALLGETLVDFFPLGKAANGNPDILLEQLSLLDERWAGRPQLGASGQGELMKSILELAQVPNRNLIIPDQPPQPEVQQGVPGPPDLNALPQPGAQGQAGAAPVEIISQPPSATNTGGNRTIRAPQQ